MLSTFTAVPLGPAANGVFSTIDPTFPKGNVTLGGVPFSIPSTGKNVVWNNVPNGPAKGTIVNDFPVGVAGVTQVHTLINTAYGQRGPNSYLTLEFIGSAGADYKLPLIGNVNIRDFNKLVWTNYINNTSTVNVFNNPSHTHRIDMQNITLPAAFATQTLTDIKMIDNGAYLFQRAILYGITVSVPPVVELDINSLPAAQKLNPGGLVVMAADNNDAPRAEITIQKSPYSVVLTENNSKLKVFYAGTGNQQVLFDGVHNVFSSAMLPVSLFVEGSQYSDTMRDATLTATANSPTPVSDRVAFTVLWVDQPTINYLPNNTVSDADSVKPQYMKVAGTSNLGGPRPYAGTNMLTNKQMTWYGWGIETQAVVHPADFNYPISNTQDSFKDYGLILNRDEQDAFWQGSGNKLGGGIVTPLTVDASYPNYRDDVPSATGTIYDVDAPGIITTPSEPKGFVQRERFNFRAFATIRINGVLVRSSNYSGYYVDMSIIWKTSPTGVVPVVLNDVKGDNSAGYGTTHFTWNLV